MVERTSKKIEQVEKPGVFLASHAALDLLNTEWPTAAGTEDFFETDGDVFSWLRQTGLAPVGVTEVRPSGSLVRAAHALRSVIRILIEARKAGKRPDLSDLNAFLAAAQSHPQLIWSKARTIEIQTSRSTDTAEQVLAPIAVKAAELLANGDFERVRRCDSETCVHWFYDLTRPGRRRWCSMATCGNRLKVKEYRRRLNSD
ncbi:CGNR zinc finger domain-containing protein [Granulicella mallensis]|nr:ABATE domain-containing protein [Granulicella mallensis]